MKSTFWRSLVLRKGRRWEFRDGFFVTRGDKSRWRSRLADRLAARRDRGATGKDPHVTARMPNELIVQVEAWAFANETSRSEAIRRLVELGLKAKK